MFKPFTRLSSTVAPLAGVLLLAGTAITLSGCVVRAGFAAPPPPPPAVYVAPPPAPAVVAPAPAADAEVQASEAPPALPVYEQPACPVEGYLWTPGYWAFGPGGYFWVPGTWVAPPRVGFLWTPGYWGFVGAVYVWHGGYWGQHVGFYGGVRYGFGYGGVGFAGGRWVGNSFAYNQTVTNVNVTVVHNTYNETVVNNTTVNRVSYNGGAGGIAARPTPQERMAAQEPHVAATAAQTQHVHLAASNPALLARNNGGRPSIAATPRPSAFNAPGAVGAHGAAPRSQHGQPALAHANHPNGAAGGQAHGKPQPVKAKAAKPHPKAKPEEAKHEPDVAQR
ncbi:MAG: hypothetical protein WAK94_08635 [Steroidobacteraceae bacterium]